MNSEYRIHPLAFLPLFPPLHIAARCESAVAARGEVPDDEQIEGDHGGGHHPGPKMSVIRSVSKHAANFGTGGTFIDKGRKPVSKSSRDIHMREIPRDVRLIGQYRGLHPNRQHLTTSRKGDFPIQGDYRLSDGVKVRERGDRPF